MSDFELVFKVVGGYLVAAYVIGVITLVLMWWSEGREVSIGEYFKNF